MRKRRGRARRGEEGRGAGQHWGALLEQGGVAKVREAWLEQGGVVRALKGRGERARRGDRAGVTGPGGTGEGASRQSHGDGPGSSGAVPTPDSRCGADGPVTGPVTDR